MILAEISLALKEWQAAWFFPVRRTRWRLARDDDANFTYRNAFPSVGQIKLFWMSN
jgi:hypothetical protein